MFVKVWPLSSTTIPEKMSHRPQYARVPKSGGTSPKLEVGEDVHSERDRFGDFVDARRLFWVLVAINTRFE
jgi:hypothetical protein